jgi:UDP-N-acetylmuramoyl-L-alanyl-D-glutamate--2,6-diaminopimelate ligase
LGLEKDMLARGLNFINPVEGRFNVVNLSGCYVVIDYAHTPDGLLNVLKTARELTDKKVYVMFGCGGDRDKGKRPIMGAIAEKFADYVCLTSDNPRNEEPEAIVKDIERGMKKPHFVEISRKLATNKMLNFMQKGDILIIAGKGAEKYQEINGNKYPYNDFDTVYQYYKDSLPFKSKGRECYDC